MTQQPYTFTVGKKFYPDGRVRTYPGNTVICFVDPQSNTYQQLTWVQEQLARESFVGQFALLPISSFHMTVFQLICDQMRVPEQWSSKLALDAPLAETDTFFIEAFKRVPLPDRFEMRAVGLIAGRSSMGIHLEPANDETHKAIWDYRRALSEATGVRFLDFDRYRFHITLAYRIFQPTDADVKQIMAFAERMDEHLKAHFGVFDTGKPHLTFFDDMFRFALLSEYHTLVTRQA